MISDQDVKDVCDGVAAVERALSRAESSMFEAAAELKDAWWPFTLGRKVCRYLELVDTVSRTRSSLKTVSGDRTRILYEYGEQFKRERHRGGSETATPYVPKA